MILFFYVLTSCVAVNSEITKTSTKSITDFHDNDMEISTERLRMDDGIKEKLDKFVMVRKRSFYVTPPFEMDLLRDKSEAKKRVDPNKACIKEDYANAMDIVDSDEVTLRKPGKMKKLPPTELNHVAEKHKSIANTENRDVKSAQSYDYDFTYTPKANKHEKVNSTIDTLDKEFQGMFARQTDLIQKLGKRYETLVLAEERQSERADFADVLRSINERKKRKLANSSPAVTLKPVKRDKGNVTMINVLTMLDETEIKDKVLANPFVQRILNMVQEKKERYFRRAEEEAERNKDLR